MPPKRRAQTKTGVTPSDGSYEELPGGSVKRDEESAPVRKTSTAQRQPDTLTAPMAGRAALRHIADLTAKEIEAVTRVEPVDAGWLVEVEVVEDRRIPSSGDVLGLYEAEMDGEGSLVSYRRLYRYRRGTGGNREGGA
ncbi:gas vesicle protein [Planotetraspora sp. A-T 1434]|uniref:gas vesicle protein n=1 Tax=Planotetraspora sp. A-T 1434 TaxID=2979219 RepID=UPI0021C246A2|nr:gas vesicle protein [Planotetraspora sp. A-T 1434]MCT9933970.1 gas vesicle protein [Planotetraspora sp. A-T 1434]